MRKLIACVAVMMAVGVLGQAQCNTRVGEFLKESGYTFKPDKTCKYWINNDALAIPREGMQGAILIADQDNILVIGGVVRLKANLELSAANLTKLLQLNNELEYLKAGIDHDGDLFVRVEIQSRLADAEWVKTAVKDVIRGSTKAYEETK